jgi:myo-inositol-1(or 4)-monophosphatase
MSDPREAVSPSLRAALETTAAELALLAGAEITASISRPFEIAYKSGAGVSDDFRNPVSEIDRKCEVLIRARLGERFPDHDIIGEEMVARSANPSDFVWAVDPIDGTTNFINGFPLYAASIGLLYRGYPLIGAVWCASTHAQRAGVYHGAWCGPLSFDGLPLSRRSQAAVRRHLGAEPSGGSFPHLPWDVRQTGSAAIECAFTAAGMLRVTRFDRPNLWDVAGGVALVLAAGGVVMWRHDEAWEPFERFEGSPDLGGWRESLLLGDAEAVALSKSQQ